MPGAIKYRPRARAVFISRASYLTIRAGKGIPWFANVQSILQGLHFIRANLRSNLSGNPLFFIHTGLQPGDQGWIQAQGTVLTVLCGFSLGSPSEKTVETASTSQMSLVTGLKPCVNDKQQVFLSDRFLHRLGSRLRDSH
jgi:hypothetical protein